MTEHQPPEDTETSEKSEVVAVDIGKTLRRAREALNLQIEQAARQLHLDVRLLKALEADDFSALPGTTYAYGYIRSYAKLLKISEEDILQQFMQLSESDANELIPDHMSFSVENKVPGISIAQIFIIIIVILVVLGGLVWLWKGEHLVKSVEKVSAKQSKPHVVSLPVTDSQDLTPDLTEEKVKAVVKKEKPQPDSVEVKHVETVSTPKSIRMLHLSYDKDSWTEVRDAKGETLIYRMVKSGENLTLEGEPPYTILLGFAPGVTVTYENSVFDTKPYRRNDIAYFRIGKKRSVVATEK